MPLAARLAQVTTGTPTDCALNGLCALASPERPVPSGLLFVAVGLVALGWRGLLVFRRRSSLRS